MGRANRPTRKASKKKGNRPSNSPIKKAPIVQPQPPVGPKNAPDSTAQKGKRRYKAWEIIVAAGVVISLVSGLVAIVIWITDLGKSAHDRHKEEKIAEGYLVAPFVGEITNQIEDLRRRQNTDSIGRSTGVDTQHRYDETVTRSVGPPTIKGIYIGPGGDNEEVQFGLAQFSIPVPRRVLNRGVNLSNLHPLRTRCGDLPFDFIVKEDRLYIASEFHDLMTGEIIGSINFNRWRLYRDNLMDWRETESSLQVVDKRNRLVFSLEFEKMEGGSLRVFISGYFVKPDHVFVIITPNPKKDERFKPRGDTTIQVCVEKSDSDWQQRVLVQMERLKPAF